MTLTDQQQPTTPSPMPEGGQAKYYNPTTGAYDWRSHAVEAEWRASQRNAPTQAPSQPAQQPQTPAQPAVNAFERAAQELKAGAITPETKLLLAQAGATPDFIASLEVNTQAATVAAETEAYSHLGGDVEAGKQVWQQIETWAKANLSDAERQQYSELLGRPGWKATLDTLKARAGVGAQPALLGGGVPGAAAAQPFSSVEEQSEAINAPHPTNPKKRRYDIDLNYRREVEARIKATAALRQRR